MLALLMTTQPAYKLECHTRHLMMTDKQLVSSGPRKGKMDQIPGIVHQAMVGGEKAVVYLTLESIGLDKKPRYRYAPGHPMQHELIPADVRVEVGERVIRFYSIPVKGLRQAQ